MVALPTEKHLSSIFLLILSNFYNSVSKEMPAPQCCSKCKSRILAYQIYVLVLGSKL